ncbi:hypothetical protein Ocepr_0559 [Oceanithermus profundus DSM 14977]|uniref:DUF5666 domain-containing protein n=1 Tax=Oceanithermus profundus (strain DSM 14977 / NBRC 100410 / VKM B-2274 / 506) TaxID=670487 RepID=E4U714_OCEP5|nr:DUF5666 domain-containing protein [Oceanithermus profundus]ADR36017.1 hypothetical protein Ocepr_0559 [Oceanithermus profundus DSM 14977]
MRIKGVQGLLALTTLLVLAACGTQPGANTATSVTLAGVVGGTDANPTLSGQALDLSSASVTVNGDAVQTSVRPGMFIYAQGVSQGGTTRVQSVDVQIEVKGPIESVDVAASLLTLVGQTVSVDALTRIYEENPDDTYTTLALADLQPGDYVEVSGTRQADGSVLATRIERKLVSSSDPEYGQVEVKGTATNLDTTAMTFDLGAYAVDYSGATVEGTPAEGAFVEVKGQIDTAAMTITATKVEFKSGDAGMDHDGDKAELYGPVVNLDEAAMTFELGGFLVDYGSATLEGTLAEGAYVEVKGTFDADDPALIHATKVEVKYEDGGEGSSYGEVKGPVEAIDTAAMWITVAGQTFWADANTIVKQDDPDGPLSFDQVQVGDWVEVKYGDATDADGRFYATKIEVKGGASDGEGHEGYHELEGAAAGVDAAVMTFQLGGYTVVVNDATVYEVFDAYVSAADFWNQLGEGDRVEVKGNVDENGDFLAVKIERSN